MAQTTVICRTEEDVNRKIRSACKETGLSF